MENVYWETIKLFEIDDGSLGHDDGSFGCGEWDYSDGLCTKQKCVYDKNSELRNLFGNIKDK